MAAQKTLSLLIVLLLSVTCILGKPTEEKSNDDFLNKVKLSKEQQPPKYQLLFFTHDHFKDLAFNYVNEAQNISKNILKDETLLGHSSSVEIEGFKRNLTDFIELYTKYQGTDDIFGIVDNFANPTEFYMELPKEAITADTAVIIDTLKKYGSDKLEKKFAQLFDDFVEKFKLKFEEVKASLHDEKALLEWFDRFKALTNVDDKINAFEEFSEFF